MSSCEGHDRLYGDDRRNMKATELRLAIKVPSTLYHKAESKSLLVVVCYNIGAASTTCTSDIVLVRYVLPGCSRTMRLASK